VKHISELHGHSSNIFCTLFDRTDTHIFSSGNDRKILRFDLNRSAPTNEFSKHAQSVNRLAIAHTDPNLFFSASQDGFAYVWDLRTKRPQAGVYARGGFTSVDCSPTDSNLFVTGHSKQGTRLWDLRVLSPGSDFATAKKARCVAEYWSLDYKNVSGVSFSKNGQRIVASVRKAFPMVFNVSSTYPIAICYHSTYKNSTTMKSITFGGPNDEFVVRHSPLGLYAYFTRLS